MNKNTTAVHAGQRRQTNLGVVNPIDPSTAFQFIDEGTQYYPRYFNTPNQTTVVDKLRQLESADDGLLFGSGMAAISTTMQALLKPGDHVVLLRGLYGGTHSFVTKDFHDLGIQYDFAGKSVSELMDATRDNTKMIFVESPTNPLLQLVDLARLSASAKSRSLLTVIDNTFATPINQNPIELGIDVVIHSGTKYLGGHSDLSFGAALGNQAIIQRIRNKAIHLGSNINAITCYLIERSLKTLAIRVERQNQNAAQIASFLSQHDMVGNVFFPGLPDHEDHEIAKSQMHDFGGMLSFELLGNEPVQSFLQRLELITPAMSLGGVESTITMPVFTSHRLMPQADRQSLGIGQRLARLSVGIESVDDLIDDLQQALASIPAAVG